jgi:ribosomal protein S18 acetylase RimI-like enzyme
MRIRTAQASDIADLVNLINRAYRAKDGAVGWTNEGHLLEGDRTDASHIEELITLPGSRIVLCHSSEGGLVGSVHLIQKKDHLYFGMLAVDPSHQSAGIGRFLVKTAKEIACGEKLACIKLTVLSTRKELIDWYTRSDFRIVREDVPFPNTERFGKPRVPLSLIQMEWSVSAD